MGFGEINPSIKNLLPRSSTWTGNNTYTGIATYTSVNSGVTTAAKVVLSAATPATSGNQQISPALKYSGQGFVTNLSTSRAVDMYTDLVPIQGLNGGSGYLRTRFSLNNGALTDMIEMYTLNPDGNGDPLLKFYGAEELRFSQSSGDPSTSSALLLTNVSGSTTNISNKFGSTIKSALGADSAGNLYFKKTGSAFYFTRGSSISSQSEIAEFNDSGLYCNGYGAFQGKVSAGSAQTSPPATLNTFGSISKLGILVTSSTYLIGDVSVIYGDADNASQCSGTATACSTYTGAGQSTCNSHSGVGCSWFTGTPCTTYNGTDQSTCESGHSPCSWESTSCAPANNTDPTTCSNLNSPYGGSCTWDTGICPSQTTQVDCQAVSGCTWNFSDCHGFDATDQGTCEAHGGCAWTGGNCHAFDNTDFSTCITGHTGCSWNSGDCHPFDFTDQATCETGHPGCTWAGADCSAFTNSDQTTCETGHTGCTWASGLFDCHTLDFTDQTTCEAGNPGCSWNPGDNTCYGRCEGTYNEAGLCNGTFPNTCDGTYNEAGVCNGQYDVSCSGNICSGSYFDGNCTGGSWGALCEGTANCANLTDDGETACNTEGGGCSWTTGATWTFPTIPSINNGGTARMYWLKNLGAVADIAVVAGSGDTLESSILLGPGDSVTVHPYTRTDDCGNFPSQGACDGHGAPCSWTPFDCHAFDNTDQATCENGHSGCTWDGGTSCNGTYGGSCGGGTYLVSRKWYKHAVL